MSSPPLPSIPAALDQLRAEILSPDWRLSPQRLGRLRAALCRLNTFFAHRRHLLALLKMAISVVVFLEEEGDQTTAVDFLKEALAHIVRLHEEEDHDPDHEQEIVRRAYRRFQRLAIPLHTGPLPGPRPDGQGAELLAALEDLVERAGRLSLLLPGVDRLSPAESRRAADRLGDLAASLARAQARLPPDR
jgi:hypothetical protein